MFLSVKTRYVRHEAISWGRYPNIEAELNAPYTVDSLRAQVIKGNSIARGNGRAYGDSAISVQNTIHSGTSIAS